MNRLEQEVSSICNVYDQYIKKTTEIDLFIQIAENQKNFVELVKAQDDTREYIEGLRKLSNSVVLYNAAIISIYGSYELFLDEIMRAYTDYLKRRTREYKVFPEKLKQKYMMKSAEYLSNPQRYEHMGITNESVINALNSSCIQGKTDDLLDVLLLSHGGNLKTKQLKGLLQEYGFENPIQELIKHKEFSKKIIRLPDDDTGDSFPDLDQIVEERNKVGHGWIVDNRLSFSLLRTRYLPFFSVLCLAVKDLIVSKIIQDFIDDGCMEQFDKLLGSWYEGTVIGINNKNYRLKVGGWLYYTDGMNWNYPFKILNLKRDNVDRSEIRSSNVDVSIQTNERIKANFTVWGCDRIVET